MDQLSAELAHHISSLPNIDDPGSILPVQLYYYLVDHHAPVYMRNKLVIHWKQSDINNLLKLQINKIVSSKHRDVGLQSDGKCKNEGFQLHE